MDFNQTCINICKKRLGFGDLDLISKVTEGQRMMKNARRDRWILTKPSQIYLWEMEKD